MFVECSMQPWTSEHHEKILNDWGAQSCKKWGGFLRASVSRWSNWSGCRRCSWQEGGSSRVDCRAVRKSCRLRSSDKTRVPTHLKFVEVHVTYSINRLHSETRAGGRSTGRVGVKCRSTASLWLSNAIVMLIRESHKLTIRRYQAPAKSAMCNYSITGCSIDPCFMAIFIYLGLGTLFQTVFFPNRCRHTIPKTGNVGLGYTQSTIVDRRQKI